MSLFTREMRVSLRPNGHVKPMTHKGILFGWVAFMTMLWIVKAPPVLPMPWELPGALIHSVTSENLLWNAWVSARLCIEATLVASVISASLAYGGALPIFRPLPRLLSTFRFLGLAGFSYASMLMFEGHTRKVVLTSLGITFFLVTSLVAIVDGISQDRYDHARTLLMSPWQVWWRVTVRGTLADAMDALRQNIAIGWVMLTTVEGMIRFEGGLGAMLLTQDKHFDFAAIFAMQGLLLGLAFGQDWIMRILRSIFFPYADLKSARS